MQMINVRAAKPRSLRQEQAQLVAELRAAGKTWAQVAAAIRERYATNARVAMRISHGLSQMQVAEEWTRRWPTDPKTGKSISYWEQWPEPTGYQPSLDVLSRLAEIYQCSVTDLLTDAPDYRTLDPAHQTADYHGLLDRVIHEPANGNGAGHDEMTAMVANAEVYHLAQAAASWANHLEPETRRSVLTKLSAGLSVAAASPALAALVPTQASANTAAPQDLQGIWRSRYVYRSDSRDKEFVGEHYVVLHQDTCDLRAESLPNNEGSQLKLQLSTDRSVVTGTWTERTSMTGHYRGAVYHGTLQMVLDPMGRSMTGKWLGFGKDFTINVGDWSLTKVEDSTSKRAQQAFHFIV